MVLLQDDSGQAQAQEDASPKMSAIVLLDGDDAGQNSLVLFPDKKVKTFTLSTQILKIS